MTDAALLEVEGLEAGYDDVQVLWGNIDILMNSDNIFKKYPMV